MSRALHLFYRDLRLRDNPALHEACQYNELLLLYVFPETQKSWNLGAASRSWLFHSLKSLQASIEKKGRIHTDLINSKFLHFPWPKAQGKLRAWWIIKP